MLKKTKILFIGDPLSSLKLASDTSLAFCEAALEFDFSVFWCEKKDISYIDHGIYVTDMDEIIHASVDNLKYTKFIDQSRHDKPFSFLEFDYCFIRKDPPFDESYKDLCWILNSQTKVKIYNPPDALLNFHEKTFPWRAYAEGVIGKENLVSTCVSDSLRCIEDFLKVQSKTGVRQFITKPWLGFAGSDVTLWDDMDALLQYVSSSSNRFMIQPFVQEIRTFGDRRVMLVNGKIHWSFVRMPPPNDVVSNLARGGHAVLVDMTETQLELCHRVGQFLLKHSVVLAGIDLIGEMIGEINITSPTGFRAYEKIANTKVSKDAFKKIIWQNS